MSLCSVSMFGRGCYYQETQRTAKSSVLSKLVRSYWEPREKMKVRSIEVSRGK